jgi:hypothetical protein
MDALDASVRRIMIEAAHSYKREEVILTCNMSLSEAFYSFLVLSTLFEFVCHDLSQGQKFLENTSFRRLHNAPITRVLTHLIVLQVLTLSLLCCRLSMPHSQLLRPNPKDLHCYQTVKHE